MRLKGVARATAAARRRRHDRRLERAAEAEGLKPASKGASMQPYVNWLERYSSVSPRLVMEIGANLAQDADALRRAFCLPPSAIWVLEPHPRLYDFIRRHYAFNAFGVAAWNQDGPLVIHAIDPTRNANTGISSARVHRHVPPQHFQQMTVQGVRMDTFMKRHNLRTLDFVKVDVEGCNFEVLEGFGDSLAAVGCLHVEAEHEEHWVGQRLWPDISRALEADFEMVMFERHDTQSDSFWINKRQFRDSRRP